MSLRHMDPVQKYPQRWIEKVRTITHESIKSVTLTGYMKDVRGTRH